MQDAQVQDAREPILNVPRAVVWTVGLLVLIHSVRTFLLSDSADRMVLLLFAFIPARYAPSVLLGGSLPGGTAADIWSFVTYSLLHADWMHLGFNTVWLLAFGSAVARRFGTARFIAFFIVTAAAGALAHLIMHTRELAPMIGASAVISGAMGAATRFAFHRHGPLTIWGGDDAAYKIPAAPLRTALRDSRVLAFLTVWFGLNLLFGLGSISIVGEAVSVAWEAHVGGFFAGLLLFSVFDPVKSAPEETASS